ncbi:uncharacterized protein LOC127794870 [Diospyros lotus]|uniref:uncharacterized protein LOC127794870 n=1 Tax=Diospyros lotus TaxID=55363 RepID=UPI0022546209|nr:uncharacterized protein LOC127794870 [Diospyros lotus]
MENFRSKSYRDGRMQMDGGDGPAPTGMHDLRSYSYSSSYASSVQPPEPVPVQIKKGRNSGVGSASKSWSFSDPELQRKKRVASYKVYSVEGKMKGSLRKGFKWVKETCNQVVYGWR